MSLSIFPKSGRTVRLVLVGRGCIATVLSVPQYPSEDSKLRASSLSRRRGGNCANTLEVLLQLIRELPSPSRTDGRFTVEPHLVSVLPSFSSPDYRFIVDSIDGGDTTTTKHCLTREQHDRAASSYIFRSEATGSRTVVNYTDLPELTLQEFKDLVTKLVNSPAPLSNGNSPLYWFHFEGRIPDTIRSCMEHLRTTLPNVRISVEVEKPHRAGLEALAEVADVVFYSRSWALGEGFTSPEACLEAQTKTLSAGKTMVCTWGEDGAAGIQLTGNTTVAIVKEPAVEVDKVVDTVGAGDTFLAGALWYLIRRWAAVESHEMRECLRIANRLAGLKISQEGFQGLGLKVREDHVKH